MSTLITQHPIVTTSLNLLPAHPGIEEAAATYEASCQRLQEDEQRAAQIATRLEEITQHLDSEVPGELRSKLRSERVALQLEQVTLPADIVASRRAMVDAFEAWRSLLSPVVMEAINEANQTLRDTGYEFHHKQGLLRIIPEKSKKHRQYAERVQELSAVRGPLEQRRNTLNKCYRAIWHTRRELMPKRENLQRKAALIPLDQVSFNVTYLRETDAGVERLDRASGKLVS